MSADHRDEIAIDGESLTVGDLARISEGTACWLTDEQRDLLETSARWYELQPGSDVVRQKWAWIGAGDSPENAVRQFVEGHCAGTGDPLPREWVRAVIAARANVLAGAHSGVRPEALDVLLSMLYADVIPIVPAQGSVGAAGSAALAHIARVACGWGGEAWRRGKRLPARDAMRGLPVLQPTQKEALALINGSTLGTALAGLAVHRARRMLYAAEAACALSMEVVRADLRCLSPLAMEARRHPGAMSSADRLRDLVTGSELVTAKRRPDSFSIRCAPTVFGAAWDALDFIETVITRELNAAVDNPLVFCAADVIEAGNFHGAPTALAMDHLKIALAQVASMSERRIFRLTTGHLSGLPSFLAPHSGVNNGLMLAQYTAASLVSECKGLAHPASVDSVPTVQHHEDHVSMAPIAARSALETVELLSDVVGIELICAAQGLEFRLQGDPDGEGPARPGAGSTAVYDRVREHVAQWTDDRELHPDLVAIGEAVRAGRFSEPFA